MSEIPQTHYLKNTAPEVEQEFVEIMRQVPLFAQLSLSQLQQLFQYSKFVKKGPGEAVIQQGLYDQEIFVLIQGELRVFLQNEIDEEKQIDVMNQMFTLFGERSLLGEARGASIKAAGEVLLLGIDLSSLSDMLDGMEFPENRLADQEYQQNITMYTLMSVVLTERFDRLVRDQYKLKHKIQGIYDHKDLWEKDFLLSTIFNELCADGLPINNEIRIILQQKLKQYGIPVDVINKLLLGRKLRTRLIYTELARFQVEEKVTNVNKLVFDLTREIAEKVRSFSNYQNLLKFNSVDDLEMTNLGDHLMILHQQIANSKVLAKPLSKAQFLTGILVEGTLDPVSFAQYLASGGWTKDHFSLAYVMYLVCRCSIYNVSEANRRISTFVQMLAAHNYTARQNKATNPMQRVLVDQLVKMYEYTLKSSVSAAPTKMEETSSANQVEELLSSLGL
ncbi:cyclic nucleotide-binding domain-containing protein [Deltaproteobacteria bacterium TL4]